MRITKERIGLVLLGATLVTNPLTGQYVYMFMDIAFTAMFSVGAYIALVAGIYVGILMSVSLYKESRVNVPKKSHKAKVPSSAYIKT